MAERKKQSLLNGAIILVISTLVVKVIGLCFKMPLGSMLGLVGYGYFTSVYAIYTPIYSISMAGLPIAVSRMVAEDVALNHYREARMTLKTARKIFLLVGTAGTLLMVIISIPYAAFISDIRNLPAMIAVAPSIFFCCYVSAYRGYYEGLRNMIPTAISQVIEALGKLVIGLVFAKLIMSYGESAYNSAVAAGSATATVFGKEVSSLNEAFSVTCRRRNTRRYPRLASEPYLSRHPPQSKGRRYNPPRARQFPEAARKSCHSQEHDNHSGADSFELARSQRHEPYRRRDHPEPPAPRYRERSGYNIQFI